MRGVTLLLVSGVALLHLSCAGGEKPSTSSRRSGALDHERPLWPMPNPGGFSLPNPAEYEVSPGGALVRDRVTGLAWQRTADEGPGEGGGFVAADAAPHCDAITLEGYSDFRLPTRIELVSLIDFSRQDPALDPVAFPGEPSEAFWTSSEVPGDAEQRFHVNFFFGYTTSNLVAYAQWVRCVRTDQVPAEARLGGFRSTSELAIDRGTGLEWQLAVDETRVTFAEAEARCASLVLAGHDDFRVPSMKELQTLVGASDAGAAALLPVSDELTWSSSPLSTDPARAWMVRFSDGYSLDESVDVPALARCVR